MRHALLAAAVAAPLASGCSGPMLSAELDVPEVRITLPQQQFPSSLAVGSWCTPTTPDCVAKDLSYDLGAQLPVVTKPNVKYHLRLTSVAIQLAAGTPGTAHGGVKSVVIRVRDPAVAADPGVIIASYVRDPANPSPAAIAVTGDSSVDLDGYVQSGQLALRVELVSDAPTPAFTADVSSTYSLTVNLDWGAYL